MLAEVEWASENSCMGGERADWSALQGCYGPATLVPDLIRQLDSPIPDERSEAIDELWSWLCHQGTVYEASAVATPLLAVLELHPDVGDYYSGVLFDQPLERQAGGVVLELAFAEGLVAQQL